MANRFKCHPSSRYIFYIGKRELCSTDMQHLRMDTTELTRTKKNLSHLFAPLQMYLPARSPQGLKLPTVKLLFLHCNYVLLLFKSNHKHNSEPRHHIWQHPVSKMYLPTTHYFNNTWKVWVYTYLSRRRNTTHLHNPEIKIHHLPLMTSDPVTLSISRCPFQFPLLKFHLSCGGTDGS